MSKLIIGVDVGGTNIKLGLVDARGRIISRMSLSTETCNRDPGSLILAICREIRDLIGRGGLSAKRILGIGFGLPGLVDPRYGKVIFLPNVPGWKNVSLGKIIAKELKIPAVIENDVNLIALAEWKFGAGAGARNMICMTLGTGVGGGLILRNELYRGEGFAAGEIGHIPIRENGPPCNCGGWGCLERAVGNRPLRAKAVRLFRDKNMTLEKVSALARAGRPDALKFWEETAVHIGNALTGIVNVLNPTRIVIGGGIANASPFMFRTIERTIKKRAMRVQGAMVKIVKAKLGEDAGIIGAQVLVTDTLIHKKNI